MKTLFTHFSRLIIALSIPSLTFAGVPVWEFTPNSLTPTTFTLASPTATATVQYLVSNNSIHHQHHLKMTAIPGITQVQGGANGCPLPPAVILLEPKGVAGSTCVLTLLVNASSNRLTRNVFSSPGHSLPELCQVNTTGHNMCFGPNSQATSLNITYNSNQAGTLYAGTANGDVYFSTNSGFNWTMTKSPNPNQPVNSIFATGSTIYAGSGSGVIYISKDNGTSWTATSAPAPGQSINGVFATFMNNPVLYAASANGHVYSTTDGTLWMDLHSPDTSAVNGLFVIPPNVLYAGTQLGNVMYSNNNGMTWTSINGQPDTSAVKNVFVTSDNVYVNTANEFAYLSPGLTGGCYWALFAQTVYSLFINNDASNQLAGTQGGYVFSLSTGDELGFIGYTLINSVFAVV